jgi:hypothetical protein
LITCIGRNVPGGGKTGLPEPGEHDPDGGKIRIPGIRGCDTDGAEIRIPGIGGHDPDGGMICLPASACMILIVVRLDYLKLEGMVRIVL